MINYKGIFDVLRKYSIFLVILLILFLFLDYTKVYLLKPGIISRDLPKSETKLNLEKITSINESINIKVMTEHYMDEMYEYHQIKDCQYAKHPLKCFIDPNYQVEKADILWYHIPTIYEVPIKKYHDNQLLAGFSMESSVNYPIMNDAEFMKKFDIILTYYRNSTIPVTYYSNRPEMFQYPNDFHQRSNNIVFINSNCSPNNDRQQLAQRIVDINDPIIKLDSYGKCLHNKDSDMKKVDILKQYKFCIAMENSNTFDYVSEKLWDALAAGCIPIYQGAPNVLQDFLPDAKAIILYDSKNWTPESLLNHLKSLITNPKLVEEYLNWKKQPIEKLSPNFRKLSQLNLVDHQCKMCKYAVERKLNKLRN